jgi:dTDP-4-dehydrorhamnose reductase
MLSKNNQILVFGRTGQVAREIQHLGQVQALGRDIADLSYPESCVAAIYAHRPRAVINAAALTGVDLCEEQEELALTINSVAPSAMAQSCATLNIPLIHISSDYVFDGSGCHPFSPKDDTAPQNVYGHSKLKGEQGILDSGCNYVILRTSWVFSNHGSNFVKKILQSSENCNELNVIVDQVGGPTPARAIAVACLKIVDQILVNPGKSGIYHFSGTPNVSWCDFARVILMEAGRKVQVNGLLTCDYPTQASRPLNSQLDCSFTEETFNLIRPNWRLDLANIIKMHFSK